MNYTSVAIVGGGIAGLSAAVELAEHGVKPTIYEGRRDFGGKIRPQNLGAQFVDGVGHDRIRGLTQWAGYRLLPARLDYDDAPVFDVSGRLVLEGPQFIKALADLRHQAQNDLLTQSWIYLDTQSAWDWLNELGQKYPQQFTPQVIQALIQRTWIEEGLSVHHISRLAFAINLAPGKSPVDRHEVQGGFYNLVQNLKNRLIEKGVTIYSGLPVTHTHISSDRVTLKFDGDSDVAHDHVILAMGPEHLTQLGVTGGDFDPIIALVRSLKPATITKIAVRGLVEREVIDGNQCAWNNSNGTSAFPDTATVFYSEQGDSRDVCATFGLPNGRVISVDRYYGQNDDEGMPRSFTTIAGPQQAIPLIQFIQLMYFVPHFYKRLLLAGQHMGVGCYTEHAARSGQIAARRILASLGLRQLEPPLMGLGTLLGFTPPDNFRSPAP